MNIDDKIFDSIKNFFVNLKNKVTKPKKNKQVKKKKERKKWSAKKVLKTLLIFTCIMGIVGLTLFLLFFLYIIITAPDFDRDKLYSKEVSILYYSDGTELARIGNQNRILVSYDDLPKVLVDAIIATEDSNFFQHKGLDTKRFAKAVFGQLTGDDAAGGASTITMQVVKNTYTNKNASGIKGIIRKFTDIYMAVFLVEKNYTKEEIFGFYVNSQWFAHDGSINYNGISGIEQASQYFFGKSASGLTLAESSILAGMFQNPRKYNPYNYPEQTRKRQTTVLNLMIRHGYITEKERDDVLNIPIESLLRDRSKDQKTSNQAVIDYVIEQVQENTGQNPFVTPMKIYTTIDKDVQNVLNRLENGEIYDFPNEKLQEGIAITSVKNGGILGLSGGRNYEAKGTERATEVRRQPGSTAKILFDYGPAIEYLNWSPSTILVDGPTTYSDGTSIKNADGNYLGAITMRTALVKSRNIPALKTFKAVYTKDPNYISDFVHSLGIDYGDTLFESFSIGGLNPGVTPLEMSAAYAAFARGGVYIKPYIYSKIDYYEMDKTEEYKYTETKVMSDFTAYLITDMLIDATASGVGGVKVTGTDIASKGGTSNIDATSARKLGVPTNATLDAWNITYNPEYAIAQWVGYDITTKDYYLTSSTGNKYRNAIMNAVGSRIYKAGPTFEKNTDIVEVEVEEDTKPLKLASAFTPSDLRRYEVFRAGTEPTEVSDRFAKLPSPTAGHATAAGKGVVLSWQPIDTPNAIDPTTLKEYFEANYGEEAQTAYQERLNYNATKVGNIEYLVYQKSSSGYLIFLGRTATPNFTVASTPIGATTYVIKSAYSIFTANMSDGLEITIETKEVTPPPTVTIDPNNPDDTDTDTEENNDKADEETKEEYNSIKK